MDAKTKVLKYLETDRNFGSGIQLYQSLPGHNRAVVAQLTRQGNKPATCQQLYYDMAKLTNIPERQLNAMLNKPVAQKPAPKEMVIEDNSHEGAKGSSLNNFTAPIPTDYPGLKKLAAELELETPDKKKATLAKAIEAHYASKKK